MATPGGTTPWHPPAYGGCPPPYPLAAWVPAHGRLRAPIPPRPPYPPALWVPAHGRLRAPIPRAPHTLRPSGSPALGRLRAPIPPRPRAWGQLPEPRGPLALRAPCNTRYHPSCDGDTWYDGRPPAACAAGARVLPAAACGDGAGQQAGDLGSGVRLFGSLAAGGARPRPRARDERGGTVRPGGPGGAGTGDPGRTVGRV